VHRFFARNRLMPDNLENTSTDTLTAQTLRGIRWTYLSTFLNAGLQVFITAVLARLLAPEAFGLVVMASLVLRFGQHFAQMGIGQAIVQRLKLTDDHVSAGFWTSTLIGGTFALMVWFAAPLGAAAFDAHQLTDVLRIMGLSFFVSGLSLTALGLLRRRMQFRAIAIAEISAYVLGYAGVGITMAFTGFGVWSLVAAALAQSTLAAIVYNCLARPRIKPVFRRHPYKELLGFGSQVSAISFLEFLNSNLDTIVAGRMAGATPLGYYSRALSLTGLPMGYMSTSLSRVLYPSLSKVQNDRARVRRAYLSIITIFAGFGLPTALGMSGAAREIILVLYGDRWAESIPVMRVVAIAAGLAMLSHFGGITLEAVARLRDKLVMRAGQLVFFALALLGLGRFGLVGYALAFASSEAVLHAAMALRVSAFAGISRTQLLQAYWPGALGGGLLFGCLYGESRLGTALAIPVLGVLAAQIVTGLVVLCVVVLRFGDGRLFAVLDERIRPTLEQPRLRRALDIAYAMSAAKAHPETEAP
jgi:lipopolysaccharide exporter